MKGSAAPLWIAFAVLLVGGYGGFKYWQRSGADHPADPMYVDAPQDDGERLTEFTLTERNGKPLRSQDLQGEVWVASVFFSSCPTVCLDLNRSLAKLQNDPEFAEVKLVSITCDPKNDTVERLRDYANRMGALPDRWYFCTGEQEYIEQVAGDMLKIGVKGVTHSQRAVVFDRDGNWRGAYVTTDPKSPQQLPNQIGMLRKALRECLAEEASGGEAGAEKKEAVAGDDVPSAGGQGRGREVQPAEARTTAAAEQGSPES